MIKTKPALKILPSLLAADLGHLADDISRVASSGADALHLDIMDPTFVPNMSFGPSIVELSRKVAPALVRNVHLMMTHPDEYVAAFAAAGADSLQIHIEAACPILATIEAIREAGVVPALAINPDTPRDKIAPYLAAVDDFLVMSVHPGRGGQKFIASALETMRFIREARPDANIMVDGGINAETALEAVRAGANELVSGSFLFRCPDMRAAIDSMRKACEANRL